MKFLNKQIYYSAYKNYIQNKYVNYQCNCKDNIEDFLRNLKVNIEQKEGYSLKFSKKNNRFIICNNLKKRGTIGLSFVGEIKTNNKELQINGTWTNKNIELYMIFFIIVLIIYLVVNIINFIKLKGSLEDLIFSGVYVIGAVLIIYKIMINRAKLKKEILEKIDIDFKQSVNNN